MSTKSNFLMLVACLALLLLPAQTTLARTDAPGSLFNGVIAKPTVLRPTMTIVPPSTQPTAVKAAILAAQETLQRYPAYAFTSPLASQLSFGSGCIHNPSPNFVDVYLNPQFFQGQHVTGFGVEFSDTDLGSNWETRITSREVAAPTYTHQVVLALPSSDTSASITEYRLPADFHVDMVTNSYFLEITLPPVGNDVRICSVVVYYDKPLGFAGALPAVLK